MLKQRLRRLLRTRGGLYETAATIAMLGRYVARRPHEADFGVFRHLAHPGVFVDIGANHGQSAFSFAAMSPLPHRIVSFEANPANARYLRLARLVIGSRFEFHLCGLGDCETEAEFYVPVQGRHNVTGEGSFHPEGLGGGRLYGAYTVARQSIRVRPFDSFGIAPDVVKIDVQGSELEVLAGMERTLEARPLLLIEASPRNDDAIGEHLTSFGYRRFRRLDDRLVPADGGRPLNWFYAVQGTFTELFA